MLIRAIRDIRGAFRNNNGPRTARMNTGEYGGIRGGNTGTDYELNALHAAGVLALLRFGFTTLLVRAQAAPQQVFLLRRECGRTARMSGVRVLTDTLRGPHPSRRSPPADSPAASHGAESPEPLLVQRGSSRDNRPNPSGRQVNNGSPEFFIPEFSTKSDKLLGRFRRFGAHRQGCPVGHGAAVVAGLAQD